MVVDRGEALGIERRARFQHLATGLPSLQDDILAVGEAYLTSGSPHAAIVLSSRLCEKVLQQVIERARYRLRSSIFADRINEIQAAQLIPAEIASCLHLVRVYGNKSRHGAETLSLQEDDAALVVEVVLRLLAWYVALPTLGTGLAGDHGGSVGTSLVVWTDATLAVSEKLVRSLNATHPNLKGMAIEQAQDLLTMHLHPGSPEALLLISTDVTKLSDHEKTRLQLNRTLEEYVRGGGVIVGGHDLVYRRSRNDGLQRIFGININEFRRMEGPVRYIFDSTASFEPEAFDLPREFALHDGELCWGSSAPDCEVLYRSEEGTPLVVLREYGAGCCAWINTGDYREYPPRSLLVPERPLVSLLLGLLRVLASRRRA